MKKIDIEVRPSGYQVLSIRIPTELAMRFLDEAEQRGVNPSEFAQEIFESALLHNTSGD